MRKGRWFMSGENVQTGNPGGVSKTAAPKSIDSDDYSKMQPMDAMPPLNAVQGNLPAGLAFGCGTLGVALVLAPCAVFFKPSSLAIGNGLAMLLFFGGCFGALLGLAACPLGLWGIVRRLARPASGGYGLALTGLLTGALAVIAAIVAFCAMYIEAMAFAG